MKKTKLLYDISFKDYFDAAFKIINNGEHIENLDEIRVNCNKLFIDKYGTYLDKNFPSAAILTFTINSENKILNGDNYINIYSRVMSDTKNLTIDEFRDSLINIVKFEIEHFKKENNEAYI